jgi:hypothetical protein
MIRTETDCAKEDRQSHDVPDGQKDGGGLEKGRQQQGVNGGC